MKQNKKPIIALLGNLKFKVLGLMLFIYLQASAQGDFGIANRLKSYLSVAKTVVTAVLALAVVILGVQLAISFMSESDTPVPKKKLIGFFAGIIVFFIIINIDVAI